MDPVSLIVAALVAGAIERVSDVALAGVDAYAALNTRLGKLFARKPSRQVVLTENQRDPQAYAAPLAKELQRSGAADSDEIREGAKAVLAAAGGVGTSAGGYKVGSMHADLSVCGQLGASEVHELPMWHGGRRLTHVCSYSGRARSLVMNRVRPGLLTAADPAGDHSVGRYENVVRSAATLFYDGRLCSAVTEASGERRHPRGCAPAGVGRARQHRPSAVGSATNRRRKACR